MTILGSIITIIFILEILLVIGISVWQIHKEDIKWYIDTKTQKYWR